MCCCVNWKKINICCLFSSRCVWLLSSHCCKWGKIRACLGVNKRCCQLKSCKLLSMVGYQLFESCGTTFVHPNPNHTWYNNQIYAVDLSENVLVVHKLAVSYITVNRVEFWGAVWNHIVDIDTINNIHLLYIH